jgi:hypothetical protein
MSDTAFFRLENMIKDTLQIEHVIHIPIRNECKILVSRQKFNVKRNELKVNLAKWNQHLDSEAVRECGSLPEVAYIRKDDYSDDESSFFSNSIRTIMSFEYDEKANPDDSSVHQSVTSAANLSLGISVPSNLSNSTYERQIIDLKKKVDTYKEEITSMAEKMNEMYNMIQTIMSIVNNSMTRSNLNLHHGGLINQRPLSVTNNPMHHHTEEEEINSTHTSGTQLGTIINHNSAISPSNIIKKVR